MRLLRQQRKLWYGSPIALHLLLLSSIANDLNATLHSNHSPDSSPPELSLAATGNSTATGGRKPNADTMMMMVHEREFVSPLVRVQMECQRDKTIVKVNFTKPFNGILSAGRLETTKCKLNGNGAKYYELQVLHNETHCDTQWDNASSSIFNTLFIRFHSSLETGSDIAKNVMCRLTVGDLIVGRRRPLKASAGTANAEAASAKPKELEAVASVSNERESARAPTTSLAATASADPMMTLAKDASVSTNTT